MKTLWIFLALILAILVGYFLFIDTDPAVAPTETVNMDAAPTDTADATANVTTITYDDGFSPAAISVPAGTTVTWVNAGDARMWIASNVHPTHTEFDGTSVQAHCADGAPTGTNVFDQCTASDTFSFTFLEPGTYSYHNHAQASAAGTVTVTP